MTDSVDALITRFLIKYPNSEWGPAHIVLSDGNLFDGNIQWCMALLQQAIMYRLHLDIESPMQTLVSCDYYARLEGGEYRHTLEELAATYELLQQLLKIPEEARILSIAE